MRLVSGQLALLIIRLHIYFMENLILWHFQYHLNKKIEKNVYCFDVTNILRVYHFLTRQLQ